MPTLKIQLIYRILMLLSFALALLSLSATLSHINNDDYLVSDAIRGQTHGWYHFFRESVSNLGLMAAVLILIFAPVQHRTPVSWWVMTVLVFSYYSPYWIGYPWHGVSAPTMEAEIGHVMQAVLAVAALIIARADYLAVSDSVMVNRGMEE